MEKKGLTASFIKTVALICMIIDKPEPVLASIYQYICTYLIKSTESQEE